MDNMENKSTVSFVPFEGDLFDKSVPRGLRYNNPLNIKFVPKNHWKGLAGNDGVFCTFIHPMYCFRACRLILRSYLKRNIDLTVRQFLFNWCPDSNHDNYVKYVCHDANVLEFTRISDLDFDDFLDVLSAMVVMENGFNPYSLNDIFKWYNLK